MHYLYLWLIDLFTFNIFLLFQFILNYLLIILVKKFYVKTWLQNIHLLFIKDKSFL